MCYVKEECVLRDSLWKLASCEPLLPAVWERDAHKVANYSERKISFPQMHLLESFNSDFRLLRECRMLQGKIAPRFVFDVIIRNKLILLLRH